MKKFFLLLMLLSACGGKGAIQKIPVQKTPLFTKPDIDKCTDSFDLRVNFNVSELPFEPISFYVFKGNSSYQYIEETWAHGPVKSYVFKNQLRGTTFYVRANATSGNLETAYSDEASLRVFTCEELKQMLKKGELVNDTQEVVLKWQTY